MQYPTNNDSSEALEKVIEPKSVSFQDEVLKKLEEEFADDTMNRVGDELDIGNLLLNRAVSMDLSSLRPIFNDPIQVQNNEAEEVEEAKVGKGRGDQAFSASRPV